jgi:hypothetical protein
MYGYGQSVLNGCASIISLLVFFSFDPVHDKGETLQFFAESYKADSAIIPWDIKTLQLDENKINLSN